MGDGINERLAPRSIVWVMAWKQGDLWEYRLVQV